MRIRLAVALATFGIAASVGAAGTPAFLAPMSSADAPATSADMPAITPAQMARIGTALAPIMQ